MKALGAFETKAAEKLTRNISAVARAYLDAGDNFAKAKCFQMSKKCSSIAALLVLQLDCPQVGFINLAPGDAKRIMTMLSSYEDAAVVANAYDISSYDCWLAALYRQVRAVVAPFI